MIYQNRVRKFVTGALLALVFLINCNWPSNAALAGPPSPADKVISIAEARSLIRALRMTSELCRECTWAN